jgi:aryl-alcohol dehydrogenase-like predicted oxidoreductase
MASAEASLKRLQSDYIDLFILHFWDSETTLEETLRAMGDLVQQGKVRYVGVSNFSAWQAMSALWTAEKLGLDPIRSIQVQYNFLTREPEREIFPMCEDQGLTITPYWVLQAGMFTGKYQRGQQPDTDSRLGKRPQAAGRYLTESNFDALERIEAVAKTTGHSPTDLTLAWALSKPVIGSVIAGTSRPEQVIANCEAVDIDLPPEALQALEAVGIPA